jgi:hypothetical protein
VKAIATKNAVKQIKRREGRVWWVMERGDHDASVCNSPRVKPHIIPLLALFCILARPPRSHDSNSGRQQVVNLSQVHYTQASIKEAEQDRDLEESEIQVSQEGRAAVNAEVSELAVVAISHGDDGSDSDDESKESKVELEEDFDIDALASQQAAIKDVMVHISRKKALVAKAATRWMTFVAVVDRVLMWRTALMRAMDEISTDPSFKKRKKKDGEPEVTALRISDAEATILTQFLGIGKSCRKTLESLEADTYPTIGALLYTHHRLL